ncbi:MAG: hypothetical protein C0407_18605 [Desulfobacca sp.]|nr:hypothetical protein [Desulfobacca sp.]
MADNFPDQYEQVLRRAEQEQIPLWQVEEETFGAHHGSVGAYLLGIWGFPNPMIEALAFHHQPNSIQQKGFTIITAVHAANSLEKEGKPAKAHETRPFVDQGYLTTLGLGDHLKEWRRLGEELKKQGAAHGKTDPLR